MTVGKCDGRPIFEVRDVVRVAQREPDVVEAVEQPVLREVVELERHVESDRRRRHSLVLDVDDDLELRVFFDRFPELRDRVLWRRRDDEAHLPAVVAEDVGEPRRQHGGEAVVHQRPHRVLA